MERPSAHGPTAKGTVSVTTDQTGEQPTAPHPPAAPSTAPPPPGGGSRSNRRLLWILLVVALVAEAVLVVRLVGARDDLARADEQLDAQEAKLTDLRAQLDRAQGNLATLRADLDRRNDELGDVARS